VVIERVDGLGWTMDMQGQSPKRPYDSVYKFSKKFIKSGLFLNRFLVHVPTYL